MDEDEYEDYTGEFEADDDSFLDDDVDDDVLEAWIARRADKDEP